MLAEKSRARTLIAAVFLAPILALAGGSTAGAVAHASPVSARPASVAVTRVPECDAPPCPAGTTPTTSPPPMTHSHSTWNKGQYVPTQREPTLWGSCKNMLNFFMPPSRYPPKHHKFGASQGTVSCHGYLTRG